MSQSVRRTLLVLLTAGVALALHLTLGWAWTVLAAVVGGFVMGRGGTLVGALGLLLPWAGLVLWNLALYGPPMQRMTEVVGGLFGGLPGLVVPFLTLAIALVLGALGGAIGASLRKRFVPARDRSDVWPTADASASRSPSSS